MSKFTINVTRVMSVLLFVILVLASVTTSVFEVNFYTKTQEKYNVAESMNVTDEELLGITQVALLYTKGYTNDLTYLVERDGEKIDVYSEQDKVHMVDVQSLYKSAYSTLLFSFIMFVILIVVLIVKRKQVNVFMLTYTFNKMSLYISGFVIFIGAFAAINFNVFWTYFHKVFFTNDLWLMDASKDALVNIFPEGLFSALVFKILFRFILFYGITNLIAFFYRAYSIKVGEKKWLI